VPQSCRGGSSRGVCGEKGAQAVAGAVQAGPDGAERDAGDVGDLLVAAAFDIGKINGVPVAGRQGAHGGRHSLAGDTLQHGVLGGLHAAGHARQRVLAEIADVDELRPAARLAVAAEVGVGQDPVQPGAHLRPARNWPNAAKAFIWVAPGGWCR
jgi:hypothetical protein